MPNFSRRKPDGLAVEWQAMSKRTWIKICGLRDEATALAAADAGADAIGLVFVAHSPRHIRFDQAQRIVRTLPKSIESVGLFVDAPIHEVMRIADELALSAIQLHGHETPEYIQALAPRRVLKSLAFEGALDMAQVDAYWRRCPNLAGFIFDAPPVRLPSGVEQAGGNGRTFDWQAMAQAMAQTTDEGRPGWILSGGLTPSNVAQAITLLHPFGVDVSSGVESSRGVKDISLIERFCRAAAQADRGN